MRQLLPIDAVPDITNVQVQINTNAPGYSPIESEQRITSHPDFPHLRYVVSVYPPATQMAATAAERMHLRALRLGGFTTNPHLRFAFATTDPVIRGNVESSVAEGEALHPIKVFDQLDDAVYECPHKFDVERGADHQAFGAGGRHFCLGTALARLELKTLLEECAKRFPDMELIGEPNYVRSLFLNQQREVWVRLNAPAA